MMTEGQQKRFAEYTANKSDSPAAKRLAALFDDGKFTVIGSAVSAKANDAKVNAGVVTGYGLVNGSPAYAFIQDSAVMGGAVSREHSAKICRLLELAARGGVPVIGVYDSKGAFVEDGAAALNAYSEIMGALANLSGVVPTVSVVAGVCSGCMALTALSADYTVMTKDGELYAEASDDSSPGAAAEKGLISDIAGDIDEAFEKVRTYLSLMPLNNLSAAPEFDYADSGKAAFDSPEDAAASLADAGSLTEISPLFGGASGTYLCTVGGAAAGIVTVGKKGEKLCGCDFSKIARFVRLCDAYGLPIITVIDCEGADNSCGCGARNFMKLAGAYAEATAPKIALITGNASGSVFVALAGKNTGADAVFALPSAVISPMAPEAAVEFLWHDRLKGAADLAAARNELVKEYCETFGSAFDAAEKGAVDEVVSESEARSIIISAVEISSGKRLNKRLPKKHSII